MREPFIPIRDKLSVDGIVSFRIQPVPGHAVFLLLSLWLAFKVVCSAIWLTHKSDHNPLLSPQGTIYKTSVGECKKILCLGACIWIGNVISLCLIFAHYCWYIHSFIPVTSSSSLLQFMLGFVVFLIQTGFFLRQDNLPLWQTCDTNKRTPAAKVSIHAELVVHLGT